MRQYSERLDYLTSLKKHFLHWQTQVEKIHFTNSVYSDNMMLNLFRQRMQETEHMEQNNTLRYEFIKMRASYQSQTLKNLFNHTIKKQLMQSMNRWKQYTLE